MKKASISSRKKELEQLKKSAGIRFLLEESALSEKYLAHLILVSETIACVIQRGNKVLLCGNGGSASDCQHWTGEMLGRFQKERRAFGFISLTTNTSTITSIANDYDFAVVFARQVEGLGKKGDILICISTSGVSDNVILAAEAAKKAGMQTISLTGKSPNRLADISDLSLCVPSQETPQIQEIHIQWIHIICGLVEKFLT